MLFLPARVGQQLHRPQRRLGFGMPNRRRTGRIRARSLCRPGIKPHPRWRLRPSSAAGGRSSVHRLLAAKISKIKPGDTVLNPRRGGLRNLYAAMRTSLASGQWSSSAMWIKSGWNLSRRTIPTLFLPRRRMFPRPVQAYSAHGGADVVLEVAGSPDTFQMAWVNARPNAIVTVSCAI